MFQVEDYVRDYEFRGEGGDYKPTEAEQEMLVDAIHGAIHDLERQKPSPTDCEADFSCPTYKRLMTEIYGFQERASGHPLHQENTRLRRELIQAQRDIDKLKDPLVVYFGLLRGGIAMPTLAQIKHLYRPQIEAETTPSDGQIYASVSRRDALKQVLSFLDSIEGAGYGGMAEFEIARSSIQYEVEGPLGWALSEEAKAQIAEIDGNSRDAKINGDRFVAGAKPSSS